jgi:hypothetical protein
MTKLRLLAASIGTGLVFAALPVSFNWSPAAVTSLSIISLNKAAAVIGRPLTPLSVAGVHRRAARREYRRDYYGTGAGIATAGAVAAGTYAASSTYAPFGTYAASGAYAAGTTSSAYNPPSFVHDAIVVRPGYSATVTDPATGRRCTISTSGYHWCWRP